MNSCGLAQNEISLDAYEIANLVFSKDDIEAKYKTSMLETFNTLDIKTYFEMLIIVTTEGLKKFYGDENNKVDITNLSQENIEFINSFLKKIKLELNIEIVSYNEWNLNAEKRKTDFRKILITTNTKLCDMYFILQRDSAIIISFKQL